MLCLCFFAQIVKSICYLFHNSLLNFGIYTEFGRGVRWFSSDDKAGSILREFWFTAFCLVSTLRIFSLLCYQCTDASHWLSKEKLSISHWLSIKIDLVSMTMCFSLLPILVQNGWLNSYKLSIVIKGNPRKVVRQFINYNEIYVNF